MKIIRARNPEATVNYMKEKLVVPEGWNREPYCDTIKGMMEKSSRNIMIFQAFEGDELKGFVIGTLAPGISYMSIDQMQGDSPDIIDELFFRICMAAEAAGLDKLRLVTEKGVKGWEQKWGFKVIRSIREYEIPEDLNRQVLEQKREILVGKKVSDNGSSTN